MVNQDPHIIFSVTEKNQNNKNVLIFHQKIKICILSYTSLTLDI